MSELPKFPSNEQYEAAWKGSERDLTQYYMDAMSAYSARLRVAVEAMNEIRRVHPLMHNGGRWGEYVQKTIDDIGPLP